MNLSCGDYIRVRWRKIAPDLAPVATAPLPDTGRPAPALFKSIPPRPPDRYRGFPAEVRRARLGPGLWPGPCRQACWGGRGSRVNGTPKACPRGARMRSTVEAGGADPDNARRSVPVPVTFPASAQLTWGWRPGPRGRARHRADTASTARGRSPGPPGAAARRAAGLPPEGRDESCRTAHGASPALTSAAHGGPPWPLISPRLAAPVSRGSCPGRQARRAEGAPLKLSVEKVVTGSRRTTAVLQNPAQVEVCRDRTRSGRPADLHGSG